MNKIQINKKKNHSNETKNCKLIRSTAQSKFSFIFTCFNKSLLETDIANAQQQPDCINDGYTYVHDDNRDTFRLMSETYKPFALLNALQLFLTLV